MRSVILAAIITLGAGELLWCVFVALLVSSLDNIRITSWHYRLRAHFHYLTPANSCEYARDLMIIPIDCTLPLMQIGVILYGLYILAYGIYWNASRMYADPIWRLAILTLSGIIGLAVAAPFVITHPSVRTAWGMLRGRLCRNLPVIEE